MMNSNINANLVIFAGGYDAEMMEIINVCRENGIEVIDHHLGWGASVDSYKDEIETAINGSKTPVLIELSGADQVAGAIVVDHHNENVDRPASILQVLDLLGLEPTRRQQLIAANDTGYIPGMLAMGATPEEIAEVRLLDRSAQGITPEQEAEAERAIAAAEVKNGVTIVRMNHSKTATVCDRLYKEGAEQRLLILSNSGESTEVNFFGSWDLCENLYVRYGEEGQWHTWKGGETTLPSGAKTGFFGSSKASLEAVEAIVMEWFNE